MALPASGLPRLYAILDAETLAARELELPPVTLSMRRAGVRLLQYRDKQGSREQVLRSAQAIGAIFAGSGCTLILNDHAELVREAGWHGVHLGQQDMSPANARSLVGPEAVIGWSTHTPEQALTAEREGAVDYVAIGPIFATQTKADAEAVVGIAGLRAVRAVMSKPLVAIGGIGAEMLAPVLAAGASSVALISALLADPGAIEARVRSLIEATEDL